MSVLSKCICPPCVSSEHRTQKRAMGNLGLESQMLVGSHVGAEVLTWVL